ncbi:histone acetyltransferase [Bombiscardovia apis]|uniref:Histone acetyltransferase n=1 Tax=Bombiscardovia apis TaxID=2932182 RepID=A0ABM8BDI5_9BIFI|nr:GNAT family N-acetyltransferase [Bombiscardovia apis]BDR54965.1 histone acetyltransferase [Bombiscardovia apis]
MQRSNPGQRWLRHATLEDVPAIEEIYARARQVMAEAGNPEQWGTKYPFPEMIEADIRNGNTYLLVDDAALDSEAAAASTYEPPELEEVHGEHERIIGIFSFFDGIDPTYVEIDGAWLDDDPYMTIHRMAASGLGKKAAADMLSWCMRHHANVRVDTGPKNYAMQHILEANGFTRCGIIGVHDDRDPNMEPIRLAYQRHDR